MPSRVDDSSASEAENHPPHADLDQDEGSDVTRADLHQPSIDDHSLQAGGPEDHESFVSGSDQEAHTDLSFADDEADQSPVELIRDSGAGSAGRDISRTDIPEPGPVSGPSQRPHDTDRKYLYQPLSVAFLY